MQMVSSVVGGVSGVLKGGRRRSVAAEVAAAGSTTRAVCVASGFLHGEQCRIAGPMDIPSHTWTSPRRVAHFDAKAWAAPGRGLGKHRQAISEVGAAISANPDGLSAEDKRGDGVCGKDAHAQLPAGTE